MRFNAPTFEKRPDPTPEEIRLECEKIQATWSEGERRERAGLPRYDDGIDYGLVIRQTLDGRASDASPFDADA